MDIVSFALTLVQKPELVVASDPEGWALVGVLAGVTFEDKDKSLEQIQDIIESEGTEAFMSHLQALGILDRWLELERSGT